MEGKWCSGRRLTSAAGAFQAPVPVYRVIVSSCSRRPAGVAAFGDFGDVVVGQRRRGELDVDAVTADADDLGMLGGVAFGQVEDQTVAGAERDVGLDQSTAA